MHHTDPKILFLNEKFSPICHCLQQLVHHKDSRIIYMIILSVALAFELGNVLL